MVRLQPVGVKRHERRVVGAGDAVALPTVYGYHRDARGWPSLSPMRLQGRHISVALPTNITGGNVYPRRLATVIRKLREQQDMTQEQLAKKAGVTQGYIAQLERGLRKNPSLPALRKLARALGVPVTELLE
jgi:DNA-binding XRE family transcriptional regulator